MRRTLRLLLVLVVAAVVIWWIRTDRRSPETRLADHFGSLCDIAGDHVESPREGVDRMFAYFGKHSPAMLEQFGATLVAIERVGDDTEHDQRAREVARKLRAPLIACEETFERFGEAVGADPEARARAERGIERLSRTLEILFGAAGRQAIERYLVL